MFVNKIIIGIFIFSFFSCSINNNELIKNKEIDNVEKVLEKNNTNTLDVTKLSEEDLLYLKKDNEEKKLIKANSLIDIVDGYYKWKFSEFISKQWKEKEWEVRGILVNYLEFCNNVSLSKSTNYIELFELEDAKKIIVKKNLNISSNLDTYKAKLNLYDENDREKLSDIYTVLFIENIINKGKYIELIDDLKFKEFNKYLYTDLMKDKLFWLKIDKTYCTNKVINTKVDLNIVLWIKNFN